MLDTHVFWCNNTLTNLVFCVHIERKLYFVYDPVLKQVVLCSQTSLCIKHYCAISVFCICNVDASTRFMPCTPDLSFIQYDFIV